MVSLTGDDLLLEADNKIAALPELSNAKSANYDDILEIYEMIEAAKNTGADISKLSNGKKLDDLKKYFDATESCCTPLNISAKFNSRLFLSESNEGTYTEETANKPDFLISNRDGADYGEAVAIKKEAIDELSQTGDVSFSGIPYHISALDNQKACINCNGFGWQSVTPDYYSEIKALVVVGTNTGENNRIYTGTKYTEGEDGTAGNIISGKVVANVARAKVYASDNVSGGVNIMEYSFPNLDTTRKLKEFTFFCKEPTTLRVLAITMVGLKGNELVPIIESKIAELPDASNVTSDNLSAVDEISKLVAKAKATGADIESIEGITRFNAIIEKRDELLSAFVPVDLSKRYNSKSFLSKNDAGTVKNPEIRDYFRGTNVSEENAFGLNKENVELLTEDGILRANGIPYNMPLPNNAYDSLNPQYTNPGISIPMGFYSEYRMLVTSSDPTNSEPGRIYAAYVYDDGTSKISGIGVINRNDVQNGLVADVGTVNATKAGTNASGGKIYEIVVNNPYPERAVVKIDIASNGSTNTTTRILAMTLKKANTKNPGMLGIKSKKVEKDNKVAKVSLEFEEPISEGCIKNDNVKVYAERKLIDSSVTAKSVEGSMASGAEISFPVTDGEIVNYQVIASFTDGCKYCDTLNLFDVILDGEVVIKDSQDNEIEKLSDISDGTLKSEFKLKTQENKTVKCISAIYDDCGNLKYVASDDVNLVKDLPNDVNITISNCAELKDNFKYKAFIWDGDMKPVTKVKKASKISKTYGLDVLKDESKDLTVAFIGGSLTEGRMYTTPLIQKWNDERTGNITMINAGVGGSGTDYGTFRVHDDVISKNPDVVFVDFTVNDQQTDKLTVRRNLESLLLQLKNCEHEPVVVILYLPHIINDSIIASIDNYNSLISHYGLTAVDTMDYFEQLVKSGEYSFSDLLQPDNVHFNELGGRLTADLIYDKLFGEDSDKYFKNMNDEEPVNENLLKHPKRVSSNQACYDASWADAEPGGKVTEGYNTPVEQNYFDHYMVTNTNGATMTFPFSGDKILVEGLRGKDGRLAMYEIYNPDGTLIKIGHIANYISGYSWYKGTYLFLENLGEGEHIIKITVLPQTLNGTTYGSTFGIGGIWVDE